MNPILIIVIIFLICFLAWYIVVLNNIKKAKLKVEEANSNIDVALTKRHDTLTKMLDVVKGYTKHEKDTLIEIVNIRNGKNGKPVIGLDTVIKPKNSAAKNKE